MGKSVVDNFSKNQIMKLVDSSRTFTDLMRYFGLKNIGNNYKTVKKKLDGLGISYSQLIERGKNYGFQSKNRRSFDDVFCENSIVSAKIVRSRLVKDALIPYECKICGCDGVWCGESISLQIDHINGINNDNRIENLRLLCPNCHSQTKTWGAKQRINPNKRKCEICGKPIDKRNVNSFCRKHSPSYKGGIFNNLPPVKRKIQNRPSLEVLEFEVSETNFCAVGRKYGVSDNAVRKWIKQYKKKREQV